MRTSHRGAERAPSVTAEYVDVAPGSTGPRVELPHFETAAPIRILQRVAFAIGLLVFVAILVYLDRDGYVDAAGDEVSLLDAFYYSTVSVTTTGYGDIRPVTDNARLLSTLLVTPARVLFLILLVGTTLEVLAAHTRLGYRLGRWRRGLRDHVIICGYGTKGHSAAATLLAGGHEPSQLVVIDERAEARAEAQTEGLATVAGDATRSEVLQAAGIVAARAIVVAPDRDDSAVLITLTARELNPRLTIVSAVREEENAHLLRQGGADSVIVSSGAAGRLLGLATHAPRLVEVLEDLLSVGAGVDIAERAVREDEVGPLKAVTSLGPVVAVVRGGELMRFDDPRAAELQQADRIVFLTTQSSRAAVE